MAKKQNIGNMIDHLYTMRATRIEAARAVDEMKAAELLLKQQIIEHLEKLGAGGLTGELATASLKVNAVPKVADWQKVYTYIGKHKAFELLQQRVSTTAWQELIDAGKKVPGIEVVELTDLSLTKSKR